MNFPNYFKFNNFLIYFQGYTYNILKLWDLAIDDFTTAIRMDKKDIRSYNNRGYSYLSIGQFQLALRDLSKVKIKRCYGN